MAKRKKIFTASKVWKIDSTTMLQTDSMRREAINLACDGLVDLRQEARSFVHSTPTHWVLSINVTNTKRALAAGFKVA